MRRELKGVEIAFGVVGFLPSESHEERIESLTTTSDHPEEKARESHEERIESPPQRGPDAREVAESHEERIERPSPLRHP